ALAAVPVRLALRLVELVEDGVPREGLIALITSRYVDGWIGATADGGAIAPHRIARALREAGGRGASVEEGLPGYQRRPAGLAGAAGEGSRRREVERITTGVERWLALLASLPEVAPCARHAAALRRVLEELRVPVLARGYLADAEAGLDDVERVAFDQAAV